ncbi:MAG: hypothetical protein ACTSQS_15010 [Promethearchaeota archaeon]
MKNTSINKNRAIFLVLVITILNITIIITALPVLIQNDLLKNLEKRNEIFNSDVKGNKSLTIELPPSNASRIRVDAYEDSPISLNLTIFSKNLELNRSYKLKLIVERGHPMEYQDYYSYNIDTFSLNNSLTEEVNYSVIVDPDNDNPYKLSIVHNPVDIDLSRNIIFFFFSGFILICVIFYRGINLDEKKDISFKHKLIFFTILINNLIWFFYSIIGVFIYAFYIME